MILQSFDGIGANRSVSLNTAQPTLQVIDGEVVALRSPIGFPLPSAAQPGVCGLLRCRLIFHGTIFIPVCRLTEFLRKYIEEKLLKLRGCLGTPITISLKRLSSWDANDAGTQRQNACGGNTYGGGAQQATTRNTRMFIRHSDTLLCVFSGTES